MLTLCLGWLGDPLLCGRCKLWPECLAAIPCRHMGLYNMALQLSAYSLPIIKKRTLGLERKMTQCVWSYSKGPEFGSQHPHPVMKHRTACNSSSRGPVPSFHLCRQPHTERHNKNKYFFKKTSSSYEARVSMNTGTGSCVHSYTIHTPP